MIRGKYECPECLGYGETECECCGVESDCESCKGSGLNKDMIDISEWEKACSDFCKKTGSQGYCDWQENEQYSGIKTDNGQKLSIEEFIIKHEEKEE